MHAALEPMSRDPDLDGRVGYWRGHAWQPRDKLRDESSPVQKDPHSDLVHLDPVSQLADQARVLNPLAFQVGGQFPGSLPSRRCSPRTLAT